MLLIEFSMRMSLLLHGLGWLTYCTVYELFLCAGCIGTSECPLSNLGLHSYLAYWVTTIIRFLRYMLELPYTSLPTPPLLSIQTSRLLSTLSPNLPPIKTSPLPDLSHVWSVDITSPSQQKQTKRAKGWDGKSAAPRSPESGSGALPATCDSFAFTSLGPTVQVPLDKTYETACAGWERSSAHHHALYARRPHVRRTSMPRMPHFHWTSVGCSFRGRARATQATQWQSDLTGCYFEVCFPHSLYVMIHNCCPKASVTLTIAGVRSMLSAEVHSIVARGANRQMTRLEFTATERRQWQLQMGWERLVQVQGFLLRNVNWYHWSSYHLFWQCELVLHFL